MKTLYDKDLGICKEYKGYLWQPGDNYTIIYFKRKGSKEFKYIITPNGIEEFYNYINNKTKGETL